MHASHHPISKKQQTTASFKIAVHRLYKQNLTGKSEGKICGEKLHHYMNEYSKAQEWKRLTVSLAATLHIFSLQSQNIFPQVFLSPSSRL